MNIFLKNKYYNWYYSIIEYRKSNPPTCDYTENHHIIPASLGGSNGVDNKVRLTAREHFICHLLLIRITDGEARRKMVWGTAMMLGKSKSQKRITPSARIYDYIRTEVSKSRKGIPVSEETKHRLRTMNLGRKYNPRTEQWKQKQRAAQLGKKDPPSAFENRSKAHAGANNPRAKTWQIETLSGENFSISGLKAWCKEHSVSYNALAHTRHSGKFYKNCRVTSLS